MTATWGSVPPPWDTLPPDHRESWPRCLDCGTSYPPDWPEVRWHIVHGCSGGSWGLSERPGEGCLCLEPLEIVQHWCEACDGKDPRSCPERLNPTLPDPAEYKFRMRNCWYNDRRTHAVRPEGINNQITACDRHVNDRRPRERPRSAEITCEECAEALKAMEAARG